MVLIKILCGFLGVCLLTALMGSLLAIGYSLIRDGINKILEDYDDGMDSK